MKKIAFVVSICIILLACLNEAGAGAASVPKNIRLTTCNWQPYSGEDLPSLGFTTQIMKTIFKRMGYAVIVDILPWKRAVVLTRTGGYDVLYNCYYSDERATFLKFSKPYIQSVVHITSLKKNRLRYAGLESLKGKRIGIVLGFVNSKAFDKADFLTKETALTDYHNVKKLLNDRIDAIVIDKYVAGYIMNSDPEFKNRMADLEFLNPPLVVNDVYAAFSKVPQNHMKALHDFNKGLEKIVNDGTYDRILSSFNIQ